LTNSDSLLLFDPNKMDLQCNFATCKSFSPEDFCIDLHMWDNVSKEPRIQAFLAMKSNSFFGGVEVRHFLTYGRLGCVGVSLMIDRNRSCTVGNDYHVMPIKSINDGLRDSIVVREDHCVDMRDGTYFYTGKNGVGLRRDLGANIVIDYEYHTVFKQKYIPIYIDKCYDSVIVKYGYERCLVCIALGKYCQYCHNYGFLIPCKPGYERSDGVEVHFSVARLEQYLSSYNRLHCMQHLLYALNYYCNSL